MHASRDLENDDRTTVVPAGKGSITLPTSGVAVDGGSAVAATMLSSGRSVAFQRLSVRRIRK
jgi:hypothetical protein